MSQTWHEWRDAPPGSRYAVLGDPIAHSWSPRMHNAAFKALGLPDRFEALRVPAGEVALALKGLAEKGYLGVNVTVPLKHEAFLATWPEPHLDPRVGAVNTVRLPSLQSTSTDGLGLLMALYEVAQRMGAKVLLLGAGGSARAVAYSLRDYGYDLTLWNRTPDKAKALAEEVRAAWTTEPTTEGFAVVLNATSASLERQPIQINWHGSGVAMDLMYGDEPSEFMRSATAAGWKAVDGRLMLLWQGIESFDWLTGLAPSYQAMRDALGC